MKRKLQLFLLPCFALQNLAFTGNDAKYISRDVQKEDYSIELDSLIEKFDDGYKDYNYDTNVMTVEVVDYVDIKNNDYIVNMSNDVIDDESISNLDKSKLNYKFIYNAETYSLNIEVSKEQNSIIEVDNLYGSVFTNLNGDIDVRFIIDDAIVYLSDISGDLLVETGWLSNLFKKAVQTVISIVVAPVIAIFSPTISLLANSLYAAAEIAENHHAAINYKINKMLKVTNSFSDGYIYGQGYMSSWRFGTKSLDYNGCGIVATYNTLKLLGKNPDLASIIFDFDYRSGSLCLGFFGADPSHVKEYINASGKNVYSYYSFDSIKNNLYNNQVAIICQINNRSNISDGAHYYVISRRNFKYYTYNSSNYMVSSNSYSSFDLTYSNTSRLIVGFIIK